MAAKRSAGTPSCYSSYSLDGSCGGGGGVLRRSPPTLPRPPPFLRLHRNHEKQFSGGAPKPLRPDRPAQKPPTLRQRHRLTPTPPSERWEAGPNLWAGDKQLQRVTRVRPRRPHRPSPKPRLRPIASRRRCDVSSDQPSGPVGPETPAQMTSCLEFKHLQ